MTHRVRFVLCSVAIAALLSTPFGCSLSGTKDQCSADEDCVGTSACVDKRCVGVGSIKGALVDASAYPVAGATCTIAGTDKQGTSDINGFFTINKVPVGSYILICRNGPRAYLKAVEVTLDQVFDLGVVELVATGKIVGAATLSGGTDHSGIEVTLVGTPIGASTSATGDYTIADVPAGKYALRFSKAGYLPLEVHDVAVTPGQTLSLKAVQLSPFAANSGMIAGRVQLDGRSNHQGSIVTVVGCNSCQAATTDQFGNYQLVDVPVGTQKVRLSSPGFLAEERQVQVTQGQATEVSVVLKPDPNVKLGAIEGTVTLGGSPSASATVELRPEAAPTAAALATVPTNAQGKYRFDNVAAGKYLVRGTATGYQQKEVTVDVAAGATATSAALDLVPAATGSRVEGRVLAKIEGAAMPVSGVQVALIESNHEKPAGSGVTDGQGKYAFSNVPAGTYFLFANSTQYGSGNVYNIVVQAGKTTQNPDVTLSGAN